MEERNKRMINENKFDINMLKNPKLFKVNCLPAHSDHVVYRTDEELERGESGFRECLNGIWKFHYAKNLKETIPGFEKPEYDTSDWDDIHVPAHIQMEGYDKPAYVNTQYPWDGREAIHPGQIPEHFNPVASYVTFFNVPARMQGQPLFICFEGVESGFALYLNGQFVGYSEDSFTPSAFELTPYLRDGENKLAVQVFKWTAGSFFEDQDFYRFSGIFRDVYLYTEPSVHVSDVRIKAMPDAELTEADFRVSMQLTKAEGSVEYVLMKDGQRIVGGKVPCASTSLEINATIDHPILWSAEAPELYDLTLHVYDDNDVLQEVFRQHVGFRRFEMKDGIMTINGKRIVFHGVNRHEFGCDSGRVVTREEVRQDIITMKRNNINAVRTCHYPDASYIYELCDEYGLYMIAESNMETHGTWDMIARGQKPISEALPGDSEEYLPLTLDRQNSNFQLHKNHPAILIWSIGNESLGGSMTVKLADFFREKDDSRLVHYEGTAHDRRFPDATDMESEMYTTPRDCEKFIKENPEKPFILCEYLHSMGNSTGNMFKYIDLEERLPKYQGGFIWDFVDQTIRTTNRYGEEYQAYGGDCGERPTDYDFSANGICDAAHRPYAKMQEVKFCYQNIKLLVSDTDVRIINKNLFINANAYICDVRVEKEGRLVAEHALEIDVPALSEKTYPLPVEKETAPGEYVITVSLKLREKTLWAEQGYEIAFGQGVYSIPAEGSSAQNLDADVLNRVEAASAKRVKSSLVETEYNPGLRKMSALSETTLDTDEGRLTVTYGSVNVGVRGEHFFVRLSNLKGGITSYIYGGKEYIKEIPRPNFWRAPTQNDIGNQMGKRYGFWKLASLYQTTLPLEGQTDEALGREIMSYPEVAVDDQHVYIRFKHWLPQVRSFVVTTYCVTADGTVTVSMDYNPDGEKLSPMPEFSFMMKLSPELSHMTYYGRGPEENYCDRNLGAKLGVYETDVKDNVQPYIVPQETGNRTGVRWAKLTDRRGHGLLFKGVSEDGMRHEADVDPYASKPGTMEFSAIPYTPDQLEEAQHPYELPRIENTVVRVSLKKMGIGGDNSWGAVTHDEFLLSGDHPHHFVFSFRGL